MSCLSSHWNHLENNQCFLGNAPAEASWWWQWRDPPVGSCLCPASTHTHIHTHTHNLSHWDAFVLDCTSLSLASLSHLKGVSLYCVSGLIACWIRICHWWKKPLHTVDCCGLLFIQAALQENMKKETDGIANSLALRCYTEIKLIKPSPTQCWNSQMTALWLLPLVFSNVCPL